MAETIIGPVVVILFIAGLVAVLNWTNFSELKAKNPHVRELMTEMGGTTGYSLAKLSPYFRFRDQDLELRLRIKLDADEDGRRDWLIVEEMGSPGFRFTVTRRGSWLDKGLASWLHFVESGDAEFDGRYRVRSSDDNRAREYLQSPARRAAIAHFIEAGFRKIRAGRKAITVQKRDYADSDLRPELIRSHLAQFHQLLIPEARPLS